MVAQQAEMEDIISSIRTTLAEETAKVGGGNADLIDAAAAQDEEILELTDAEMVSAAPVAAPTDDLVDINAFAGSGESKPAQNVAAIAEDLLGEPVAMPTPVAAPAPPVVEAAPVTAGPAADEFDRLLSQISDEQKKNVATAAEQKQALLDEEDPLDGPIPLSKPAKVEVAQPIANSTVYRAEAMSEVSGAQVALPAEVLAMALRPMVQEWLQENLAGVVEKLVKDEISKMNQS